MDAQSEQRGDMTPQRPRVLEVFGLTKTFGGIVALDNVHFATSFGEVHALLGENGAGKSTLIKVLTGAIHADAGEIRLGGHPAAIHNPRAAWAAGIGAVFQELSLIPDLTVAQNVWFRREERTRVNTISAAALSRRTRALFEELELPPVDPNRIVKSLPVAERQLIEIAKTVSQRPRILILDEATSALSPREVAWLLQLCRRLAAAGTCVIYISHRLGEVREVADSCTVFRNGRHVGTRPMRELNDDQIVGMMLGRVRERLYPEKHATATPQTLLSVRSLHYGTRLHDVSFDLQEGEILGIGGLQGQGQSELMLSLYGVHHAHGQIVIRGRRARIASPRDALAAGIGMALVPEDRKNQGLLLTKPIRENIVLPILAQLSHGGFLDKGAERRVARSAMQQLNVVARNMDQPAGNLSGGNQQKVVIAKLLQTKASILLLYDLTRGVDVGTKADIFQLMRDLAGRGYAILFYSTDMQELIHVADRIVVLSDGTVTATLQGDAMTEEQILKASITSAADAGTADTRPIDSPPAATVATTPAGRTRPSRPGAAPGPALAATAQSWLRSGTILALTPWAMLAVLVILYGSQQAGVYTLNELNITAGETLALILIAFGQTLVIVSGGIDLSIGGVLSLVSVIAALHFGNGGVQMWLVMAALVAGSVAVGATNGLLIGVTKMQPFIVTLATSSVFGGTALWILPTTGGSIPGDWVSFGTGTWLGISTPVWLLGLLIAFWLFFKRTRLWLEIRSVGSSQEAAFLSGVPVIRTIVATYALSGLFACLAALYYVTQALSGSPTVGTDYILTSVIAVVLGGTALTGGRGGFGGTIAGAFIPTLIGSVIFIFGIDSNWQTLVEGILLIAAVLLNVLVSYIVRRRNAL